MSLLREIASDQQCDDGSQSSSSARSRSANPISQLINQYYDTNRMTKYMNEISYDGNSSGSSSSLPTNLYPSSQQSSSSSNQRFNPQQQANISLRTQMLARHLYADKSEDFIEQQTHQMLESLNISKDVAMQNMRQFQRPNNSSMLHVNNQYRVEDTGMETSTSSYQSNMFSSDEMSTGELQDMGELMEYQNLDMAYEKYLDLMKQSLSVDQIQQNAEEYEFSADIQTNPMLQQPNPMETGMTLWKQGDIVKAILAFEAQVHKQPNHTDAWRMLGICHAETDDDQTAIRALTKAVASQPNHLQALLDIGVCYTNESHKMKALAYLKSWLATNPQYSRFAQQPLQPKDQEDVLMSFFNFHEEVLKMFENAVQSNPKDADLHVALGVLYNVSSDYENAIQCFKKALEIRSDDYSLWNKLGATLANASQSKEAVDCYRRALKLKPNYIRAWINLGIAHANQKKYSEAAKFYLRALSMNPKIESVWQYLGMAFTCMDRQDMVDLLKFRDVNKFRNEIQF